MANGGFTTPFIPSERQEYYIPPYVPILCCSYVCRIYHISHIRSTFAGKPFDTEEKHMALNTIW
jgi:hypothetical protein